jgi:CRISPR/Cas system-associated exonuclease Cas4 (RecB family)
VIVAFCLVSILIIWGVIVAAWDAPAPERSRSRRRRFREPSQRQIAWLSALIEENNRYRAHPKTFDEWMLPSSGELPSVSRASWLIGFLRQQNIDMKNQFLKQVNGARRKAPRRSLLASDFRGYAFCPEAFRLSLNNFTSQNIYDTGVGTRMHAQMESPRSGGRAATAPIVPDFPGVRAVEWSKSEAMPLVSSTWRMAGVPDALVHFNDGGISALELKTKEDVEGLRAPLRGDVWQCLAYQFLLAERRRVQPHLFVAYTTRSGRSNKIFVVQADDHIPSFRVAHRAMLSILDGAPAKPAPSLAKCRACGYRSVCRSKVGGTQARADASFA